jgi:large subunit ribosomal protein L15
MLTLKTLKSPKGAHKNTKRIGRGQGSGQGTQAGKGHKGQKARSGGGIRIGFEGGQMPLYRRLPKVGFSNAAFKLEYAVINLEKLEAKFTTETVTRDTLVDKGFLSGINKSMPIKILAKGEFSKPLTFKGIEKFSGKALELIKKAGGKIENA